MEKNLEFLSKKLIDFQEVTKKPENFLEIKDSVCDHLRGNLKDFYDFMKGEEIKNVKSDALPELIVNDFDLEQIWQQIELQNESLLTRSLADVSKLLVAKNKLVFSHLKTSVEKPDEEPESEEESPENVPEEPEKSDDSNSDYSGDDLLEKDEEEDTHTDTNERRGRSSIVDDDFFKLDEMEQFLNAEENKLNDPDSGNDSEDSGGESESSVDLFEGAEDVDDEEEEDRVKIARYKDFFVAQQDPRNINKRNKFLEQFEDEEGNETQQKSAFEERQERLKMKIDDLEEEAIEEKPWQLKGEVTADSRPQNSLLEEIVEFDLSTRPAPVITEATTMQLEDIIKQRVKDKVFDSVERKARPVETPLEYKKKLVLDQEKSKQSLAQIYEKEFLQKQADLDPENAGKAEEEPELHKEINKSMTSLFYKLDSLSNFHFTPKPAVPDLKIVSNLPAVSMEEVAPVAHTDANLLAPEEVKNKLKGDLIGKSERTETDKKRERRRKKLKQKVHSKVEAEKVAAGKKHNKVEAKTILAKNKNVDIMDESAGSKNVKSSTAFFSQLEDEVKSQIKSKTATKRKRDGPGLSAKKLKM